MRWRLVTLVCVLLLASHNARAVEQVVNFGANPGALRFFQHIPSGAATPMPLVVVLHGCTQTAQYATDTGWVALADALGIALVIPEQDSGNNNNRCFNWFENGDITRGSGEAASITRMVAYVQENQQVDAARIFVTGLSAGGAMTAVMLATYPEVFAAGAVVAGIPYRCGVTLNDALSCMNNGRNLSAGAWGDLVRGASTHTGPWPRVAVWHGTTDSTVRPANADSLVAQFGNVLGLPASEDATGTNGRDTWRAWHVGNTVMMEDHRISNMGHGTPVDPGAGAEQCGTAGAYVLDVDICSTRAIARFFGLLGALPVTDAGVVTTDAGTAAPDSGTVTVDGTRETFSSVAGPDLDGWNTNGFAPDALDHTGGTSRSFRATAQSGIMCNTAAVTHTLSRSFTIPANATLRYQRQLNLDAAPNINSTASFVVKVNGNVVDEHVTTFDTYVENTWTARSVDLAAYAGQTVTLAFEAYAVGTVCIAITADVWLDDIVIAGPVNPMDAGNVSDAAVMTDGAVLTDAAVTTADGAVARDGSSAADANVPEADGGTGFTADAGNGGGGGETCNCEQTRLDAPWMGLVGLLACLGMQRRKRKESAA